LNGQKNFTGDGKMESQIQMFESNSGITGTDMKELSGGRRRVLNLMRDGQWHTAEEIRRAAQGSEGLRRLRELRDKYNIKKRRMAEGSRHYQYRLVSEKFPWEQGRE
jgi:hypothetical protein